MTLLSKKLEEVRARHMDQAGHELASVIELGARISEGNQRINDALDDVLVECAESRALIHHKLVTIAKCAGLLPEPQAPREAREIEPAGDVPKVLREDPRRQQQALSRGATEAHGFAASAPNGHYGDLNGAAPDRQAVQ